MKRGNTNFERNTVALLSFISMDMMKQETFEWGNFWDDLMGQTVWYSEPNLPAVPNRVCTSEGFYFPFDDEFHRCLVWGGTRIFGLHME